MGKGMNKGLMFEMAMNK